MGYSSIKTQTFSARLSAARQFGLLALRDGNYHLTALARAVLHPIEAAELPALRVRAFLHPPLYAELVEKLGGKKVPEAAGLANWLYHHHGITASAKETAAEAFLATAREVGALDEAGVLRVDAAAAAMPVGEEPGRLVGGAATRGSGDETPGTRVARVSRGRAVEGERVTTTPAGAEVVFTLRLWGEDAGKAVRVEAPEAMSRDSFERLMQALRLMVRVEG
jgi:hypothetical protein